MKKMKIPDLKLYKNTSRIVNFKTPLTLQDIIKISLIGKLNLLLLGERGEGKTYLMEEVNSLYFNDNGIYIRARPDMKLREIFEVFNIKSMRTELKPLKNSPFTMIDEINRAPPVIQNEFFHILDGYIEFENRKVILGNGYHLVFATANYENEGAITRYQGIFRMDASILDRFHIIINLDHFMPSPLDTINIIGNGVPLKSEEKGDFSEYFRKTSEEIQKIPLTLDAIITVLYLRYGLNHCEKADFLSKKSLISKIPSICEGCHRLGEGCGYIYPPSTRFLKSLVLFSKAKAYYLKIKGIKKEFVDYEDLLEDFSFLCPWNGIINDYFIDEKYSGDALKAGMSLKEKIKREIEEKKEIIKKAVVFSFTGKERSFLKELEGSWSFMREISESVMDIAKKEGNLLKIMEKNPLKFKRIAEKTKHPLLLFMVKNGKGNI